MRSLVVLVLLARVAVADPTKAEVATIDRSVALFEKVAAAITKAGTNCAKLAAAIKANPVDQKQLDEANAIAKQHLDWYMKTYAKRLIALTPKLTEILSACRSDAAVKKAREGNPMVKPIVVPDYPTSMTAETAKSFGVVVDELATNCAPAREKLDKMLASLTKAERVWFDSTYGKRNVRCKT